MNAIAFMVPVIAMVMGSYKGPVCEAELSKYVGTWVAIRSGSEYKVTVSRDEIRVLRDDQYEVAYRLRCKGSRIVFKYSGREVIRLETRDASGDLRLHYTHKSGKLQESVPVITILSYRKVE